MTDNPQKTFDQIWVQSELVSEKTFENISTDDIIKNLTELTSELQEFYKLNYPEEIKSALKKKKMGEILFILTTISSRENVNVYTELQKQIAENEIGNFKFNPQPKP